MPTEGFGNENKNENAIEKANDRRIQKRKKVAKKSEVEAPQEFTATGVTSQDLLMDAFTKAQEDSGDIAAALEMIHTNIIPSALKQFHERLQAAPRRDYAPVVRQIMDHHLGNIDGAIEVINGQSQD